MKMEQLKEETCGHMNAAAIFFFLVFLLSYRRWRYVQQKIAINKMIEIECTYYERMIYFPLLKSF